MLGSKYSYAVAETKEIATVTAGEGDDTSVTPIHNKKEDWMGREAMEERGVGKSREGRGEAGD